jgi:hypothetical protein
VKWIKDRRGSTTVQALLFVAIFVAIVYMTFEVWKVVSIRQSLHGATYQAAKFISLNGLHWGRGGGKWAQQVWPLIATELRNNTFVSADTIRAGPSRPNPDITIWINPECNSVNYCRHCQFWIKVEYEHEVFVPPRFGQPTGVRLPLQLTNQVRGKLECYP